MSTVILTPTLKEAKRLYDLGFAIHWLLPKSKRPIETGWTTGPRASWRHLTETYLEAVNVGVRLGTPSKLGRGYLAVIDVDIKSDLPHHKTEALAAVRSVLGDHRCPAVQSGRGNGSRHYYCLTAKPFKTWNPESSKDEVKCHVPSKKPSKRELSKLSEKEIKEGIRLVKAWEISLYSDGRQVVLPPSIHPDSGAVYNWYRPLNKIDDLPLVEFKAPPEDAVNPAREVVEKVKSSSLTDFKVEEVDLAWLPGISEEVRDGIINGTGVTDGSGYLLRAASALISAGCTRNEILSALTDNKNFLGGVAYKHTSSNDRNRAANWIYKYTLAELTNHRSPESVFSKAPIKSQLSVLSAEELEKQNEEMAEIIGDSKSNGFYQRGVRGKLVPDYQALFREFESVHPYKTIADMKAVYTFNGTHYEYCTPIAIKGFAEENFNPWPEEKIRCEFHSKVMANRIDLRSFFTDSAEGRVNFQNGVLDLNVSNTELLLHSPEYGFRGVLPYEYNPFATCPFFKKWLRSIMLGDEGLVSILQEFMGYIVRGGEYKYHKALWLGGVGRNGKSTFVDVLKALIGAGNYSVLSIKTLTGDKFAGADLDGKIANFSEETSPQELADSGPFKNLTGNGDLFAQKKYGDPYSFRNRAKLIMTYNEIPDLKDLSPGMLSRPIIIPFRKEIRDDEQDRNIIKKLLEELPGIFNFAIEGWQRLEGQGHFTKSELSESALRRIKEESCSAYQWVENNINFVEEENPNDPVNIIRAKEIYSVYSHQEKYPFKQISFFRKINAHPKVKTRRKHDEKGTIYWGMKID